ncbi:pentapeptide repeat-containing protein [Planotetraspora sp. GP83]|uniref:pentapeptide repeat-containing protein n=1 Tax=Planotetraspora sp. GP83 TaxID=3156264 RepID=UPI003517E8DC
MIWFANAEFSGGEVWFSNARFSGGEVSFKYAGFSGSEVWFGGVVRFSGAGFSGGEVSFDGATFSGGKVSFRGVKFSGGQVDITAVADWTRPPLGLPDVAPGLKLWPLPTSDAGEDRQRTPEVDQAPGDGIPLMETRLWSDLR